MIKIFVLKKKKNVFQLYLNSLKQKGHIYETQNLAKQFKMFILMTKSKVISHNFCFLKYISNKKHNFTVKSQEV